MQRDINPKLGIVAVVAVLLVVGYFLWHAQTDQPAYPGLNAPHPAAEMSGKKEDLSQATPANANKMRIPGRSYNPDDPGATSRGAQTPPAAGQ